METIITTSDGSHSVLNTSLDEPYHSRHGAIRESMHVFIQNGLQYFVDHHHPAQIRVLEVGFGTGLNALLTLRFAHEALTRIEFLTLESHPLAAEITDRLNFPDLLTVQNFRNAFAGIHEANWNEPVALSDHFVLNKQLVEVQQAQLPLEYFDVVFFDAFAPNKQPGMWTVTVLANVAASMAPGAVFVTYCAKGQLKRDLRSLGLVVEALAGPPGKKEMVRARRPH